MPVRILRASIRRNWFRLLPLLVLPTQMTYVCQSRAADWPNWRGPAMDGVAAEGEYPVRWSKSEHVAWRFPLPGRGSSTPVVWGDRIFLTCEHGDQNAMLCLDRHGNELWRVDVGPLTQGKHRKGTGCNPSPVTDGKRVIGLFKSGELVALDANDGKELWRHDLHQEIAEDTLWWDFGTSPVLAGGKVLVACQQTGPSYIAAFQPENGKLLWKHDRLLPAPEESSQSYSTPIVVQGGNEELLVIGGADHVTAHSLRDGSEIWRVGGLNPTDHHMFRSIASPVGEADLVFFPYARGETLTAIRLGGKGDVTDSHVAWTNAEVSADVPTPVAKGGKIYVCQDKGQVTCLDAASGQAEWSKDLGPSRETFSASPILAGDRLYLTREDGTVFVIDVTKKGEILAENALEEPTVSTPVLIDGMILIRTFESLTCVAN